LCFEKFYNIFLSLIAVQKKPPRIRRLSPTLCRWHCARSRKVPAIFPEG